MTSNKMPKQMPASVLHHTPTKAIF